MIFDHQHYVPCLRWKQGEYQAILHLFDTSKDYITPLIEVPEIGFDFEFQTPAKSLDDHLSLFIKRVKPKWDSRLCFVDLRLISQADRMADKSHPLTFIFNRLRSQGCQAIPVTGLNRDIYYQKATRQAMFEDGRGAVSYTHLRAHET